MYRIGSVMSFCYNFLFEPCILWNTHTVSKFQYPFIAGEILNFPTLNLIQNSSYPVIPLLCLFDLVIQVILNANLVPLFRLSIASFITPSMVLIVELSIRLAILLTFDLGHRLPHWLSPSDNEWSGHSLLSALTIFIVACSSLFE